MSTPPSLLVPAAADQTGHVAAMIVTYDAIVRN
jgi:hypothetical protein